MSATERPAPGAAHGAQAPDPEKDAEELRRFETHVRNALLFLRAGGRFSFAEWSEFPPRLQVALATAGDRLACRDAALAGLSTDKRFAAPLFALFGGSDSKAERKQSLAEAVQEMVRGAAPAGR